MNHRGLVFHWTNFAYIFFLLFLVFAWASGVDRPDNRLILILIPSVIVGPFMVTKYFMVKEHYAAPFGSGELFVMYVVASFLVLTFGSLAAGIVGNILDVSPLDSRSRSMIGGISVLALLGWVFYPSRGWERCLENERDILEAYYSYSAGDPGQAEPQPAEELERHQEPQQPPVNEAPQRQTPRQAPKHPAPKPGESRESIELSSRRSQKESQTAHTGTPSGPAPFDTGSGPATQPVRVPPYFFTVLVSDLKFPSKHLSRSSRDILDLFNGAAESYFREVIVRLTSYRRAFCRDADQDYSDLCNMVLLPFYVTVGAEACRRIGVPASYAAQTLLQLFQHHCEHFVKRHGNAVDERAIASLLAATEGMLSMAPHVGDNEATLYCLRMEMREVVFQVISGIRGR